MPVLSFDENRGFEGDLEEFLAHMESVDAEMGKILRDNIDELKNATFEKARKEARERFNAKVVEALNKLEEEEDKDE